jgi:hypothetical protein
MVNATKKLIDIYEQRIKDKIGEVLDATMPPFNNIKMESNTALSLL